MTSTSTAGTGHAAPTPHAAATAGAEVPPAMRYDTLVEALEHQVRTYPDAPAFRNLGDERALTWAEFGARVLRLAAGMANVGIGRGDAIALMLTNRVEFHLLDAAALVLGAVPFSLYNTASPDQIRYQVEHAEARLAFCETRFAEVIDASGARTLEHVVVIDDGDGLEGFEAAGDRPGASEFTLADAVRAASADDVAALIYTSGTTGDPKGVELTHRNLQADWRSLAQVLPTGERGRILSYLPCAHLADRFVAHYGALGTGATVTCVADPTRLLEALVEVRPTIFAAVPRLWEKLQSAILARARREPDVQAALDAGPTSSDPEHVEVREQLRQQLGFDELAWAVSGSAPIDPAVLDLFAGLGVPISEVWGMTEVGCVGTANPLDAPRYGTVGRAIPDVEVKLAADGELLLRGPNVMRGYLRDPERTAEVLVDGWMHTGDVATIDADGYVTIVDRKKDLIINSSGKNMSPAAIERAVKGAGPLIGQACVIGDRRPYVVALVVLDPEGAAGLDPADPSVRAQVEDEVARANATLSRAEQVRRFELLTDEWQADGEELTPTAKLKRKAIEHKYAEVIERLYA